MIGLLGFVAVFAGGRWLGWPARWVWLLAWGWLLVLLLAHAPFMPPELGAFVGGEFRGWFVLGVLAALVLAYRAVLGRVRRRVTPVVEAKPGAFSKVELDRYARHIMLREIGGPGQKSLKAAKVLVVGAGGLGSPALLYLAASGVGVIGVIDGDGVEGSNLQRQIIHTDARIGMPKVFSAEIAMKALNPFIEVRPYHRRLDADLAAELVAEYDLVLDGTDNFDTRYLVNRVCAAAGKPLIAAAITQWEGQISLYDPAQGGPCFECVFPVRPAPGMVPTCAEAGVAAPLPGVIGAMMAMEAVKHLTGAGQGLRGRLMIHDALYAETRVIGVKRRAGCAACGGL
ncbi:HesA/MoeB/ThiF family protein [Pseudotabrizicola sp. 4114]|uniref:HesA/MoeB/ThiF family protein n=1 Tax=Pseudotabrizicola sp. 4114 TaxID=2817731 RepID=UPI0028576E96|nr:molybdopterin/thiamine biosynthesis adenylyltransferase [Pseudorhodobacter sp. 4114]